MRPRQDFVRQAAYYGATLAVAAIVPTITRALSQVLSPENRASRRDDGAAQGTETSLLAAAVVGAAIGAGVALLFAPASGHQSRAWLAQRTRELGDRVGASFDASKEVVTPMA